MQDNIRGLVQDISEILDAKANALRAKTTFAGTRPADAKTFMLISRNPRGLTELAQALGISRQAAHKSLQRLIDIGVVQHDFEEGSRRNMIASLTEKGLAARAVGLQMAQTIDKEIASVLGKDDAETLRDLLARLREGLSNHT